MLHCTKSLCSTMEAAWCKPFCSLERPKSGPGWSNDWATTTQCGNIVDVNHRFKVVRLNSLQLIVDRAWHLAWHSAKGPFLSPGRFDCTGRQIPLIQSRSKSSYLLTQYWTLPFRSTHTLFCSKSSSTAKDQHGKWLRKGSRPISPCWQSTQQQVRSLK
jgi:hypothetical protein